MESAPWGYRSFERIRIVNRFGVAAERILTREWAPETHDLATLPAQVEELTGALNYLQNFHFAPVFGDFRNSPGHQSPLSRA